MGILRIANRFVELIINEGPAVTTRRALTSLRARIMRLADRRWECSNHVLTMDEMSLDGLVLDESGKKHGFTYVPSFCRVIHNLIWNVEQQIEASEQDLSDFVFIDYGSGKGQALLSVAEYPFKEIIGLEFSTELHRFAENNLDKFKAGHPHASPIKLLNIDATEFDLPDNPCILYFYNPFDEVVMRNVISRIQEQQERTSSPLYILYAELKEEDSEHVTANISIISALKETSFVPVSFHSILDWFLLASHRLSIHSYADIRRDS